MSFLLEKSIWSSIFAVPTGLVDNQIKLCSEVHLKVLLVVLRYGGEIEIPQLSLLVGKSEAAVAEAILYWQQAGFLTQSPVAAQPEPAIAVPQLQPVMAASAPVSAPADMLPEAQPVLEYAPLSPDNDTGRKIKMLSGSRNRLSTKEINQMAQDDENIGFLLQESQSVLGKTLTPVATDTIASLYSYYGMQPDLILMLLQYCVTIGKENMRYVEKVAASWIENGVDTHEKAEEMILRSAQRKQEESQVKTAFGIYDRKLVSSEKEYIRIWVKEFGFDVGMITLAFERAVEQKGKLSFPYINGILSNWRTKGITTPAQAAQDMKAKPGPAKKSAGAASYDIDELENIINYQSILD